MEYTELKIPFTLAQHILREKKHPQMRVWLAMKAVHGSWCAQLNKNKIASLCGFSTTQTVDYHLNKLLEWNWVGTDGNNYYFRSTYYVCKKYGLTRDRYKGYYVDIKRELTELQSVLFMLAVKHIVSYRKFKGLVSRSLEQGASEYTMQDYKPTTLSVRLLSQIIGISINMVHRLKMSCLNIRYLTRKKNSRLVLNWEWQHLANNHEEKLFTWDNVLKIRLSDDLYTFC